MPQTAIEKIVQRYAVGLGDGQRVHAGDYVTIRPKHIMTHDNTGAVIPKFRSITGENGRIKDPAQPVFGMDHDIQNKTPEHLAKYGKIRTFAERNGIAYYPPGRGIAHQIMVEQGYVIPGSMVVGSDSHSNIYGAIGAVGTPVVRTDAAAIWATGQTWWQIPPQIRVEFTGKLRPGVTGKDVIITLCGYFANDEVLNAAVEFHGPGVETLTIEDRLTISNMTTEWGALVGMFPFDQKLKAYLIERAEHFAAQSKESAAYNASDVEQWWKDRHILEPDTDAVYEKVLTLDLSTISAHVSGPNSVKVMHSLDDIARQHIKIHKAYLMSCVNARLGDFREASRVLDEHGSDAKINPAVKLYIAAASSEIESEAKELGYWNRLVKAGAIELPPGCGACIGLGAGTLEPGEVGISATNRNFQGRMGSREALCYLASPAVVIESAIRGEIAPPEHMASMVPTVGSCTVLERDPKPAGKQQILDGFPAELTGRVLYLPEDNLNTDGIYGKDVTYRDEITFEQQGQYAMLNYDPEFQNIAKRGDILVGGRNFGTGSSREQAATALASRGIQMVIAATAGQTYKRNAFNNGFIVVECPALVDHLAELEKEAVASGTRTIPGPEIVVDFQHSQVSCDGQVFPFGALSTTAQELIVAGGCENLVRKRLNEG
ncbi:MAG TPA: homoaconitase [Phycisphaerales bacterium]|nr:homoaconitase [Phycisphaerales bacterium]